MHVSKLHTQPLNTTISVVSLCPGLCGSWHGSWNSFRSCRSGLQQLHTVSTIISSTLNLLGRERASVGIWVQHFRLAAFQVFECYFIFLMAEHWEERAQPFEINSAVNSPSAASQSKFWWCSSSGCLSSRLSFTAVFTQGLELSSLRPH